MTTDNPTLQVTLINLQDVLKVVSDFCDQTQPFVGERFKKQLRNTIRAVPRSRAPVVAPQGDAAFRQCGDVNGKPLEVILGQLGSPASREDVENFRRLIEDIRRDERAASSPASSPVPPEQKFDWAKWKAQAERFCNTEDYAPSPTPAPSEWDILALLQSPAATSTPVEQERDLVSRQAAIDLINVCTCGSSPEFRPVGMRHHAIMCQTHVATLLLTLPAAVAPPASVREAAEAPPAVTELTRLRQAIGWICDACDAAYIEDPNNERIHELFNIAAQAAGLTRRLPDEYGRFDETSIG